MKPLLIPAFIALLAASNGCGQATDTPATSKAEIVGTYTGHYADGIETFEIRYDGTFSQTFHGGTNTGYSSSGKWLYETNMVLSGTYTNIFTNGAFQMRKISDERRSVTISRISFTPLTAPAGTFACVTNTIFQIGNGTWRRNPIRIEFGPWPLFVTKVEGK